MSEGEKMKKANSTQVKPYLRTHQLVPENQETPISFAKEWLTDLSYFYRRNHFPYPETGDLLYIHGEVNRPVVLRYQDILAMPSKTLMLPLECAGNKRALFEFGVYGDQWEGGALSQAVWRGVSLNYILQMAGILPAAREIVFTGADFGTRTDLNGYFLYARSLPLAKALHPDTMIAYELNGRPIPYKHGFPLRLIVPQWYGMASVKWLVQITAIDRPFEGPFQTIDYVYYPDEESDHGKAPVTTINVNSIIQYPLDYSVLNTGTHPIQGIAWTGQGEIVRVEVSTDDGAHWERANLYSNPGQPYAWTYWSYEWKADAKGDYTIRSRSTDSYGRIQPLTARWNRKGYGYNAVSKINVKIE